ncbi:hypothetical protein ABPG74_001552 [Tetrahymena malaccensis]
MKKLAFLIIHLIFCICNQIPNPPTKFISFTLYDAKIKFYSNQESLHMNVDFSSNITYFTSPDCVNCLIYNDNKPATVTCGAANSCIVMEKFSEKMNQSFSAQGDIVQIRIFYQEAYLQQIFRPLILQKAFYVKNIFQIGEKKPYQYYSLGLGFEKNTESSFLSSLYLQGKIDQLSYSIYLQPNDILILTLGGYDIKLISEQFIIMKNIESQKYMNDLYQANVEFFGQPIETFGQEEKAATVYIDPNIQDEIILPQYMFKNIQKILTTLRQEPDLESLAIDNLGKWSTRNNQQTFGLHFYADDNQGEQNKKVDVLFDYMEFMEESGEGYRPRIFFNPDKDVQVVQIGRMFLKKIMLYKYNPDQPREPVIRAFAPLKKLQTS